MDNVFVESAFANRVLWEATVDAPLLSITVSPVMGSFATIADFVDVVLAGAASRGRCYCLDFL